MTKPIRLAAMLAALLPAAAIAAEEGASGGGMPQLRFGDPMLLAQVVWLVIIFGLLYYVMNTIALPRVAEVLEERRRRFDGDLEAAEAAKRRADTAMAEHAAATARARAEAQSAIAAAAAQAQAEAAQRAQALNERLDVQIEQAERRIAAARGSAMAALGQIAADTAEALVSRLTGAADRAAVDRAVGRELQARGHA